MQDFGEAQTNVQEQSENEEKEQVGAENTKYGDEYGNKSSIFRKWWFWILVGMFLYEVFKQDNNIKINQKEDKIIRENI